MHPKLYYESVEYLGLKPKNISVETDMVKKQVHMALIKKFNKRVVRWIFSITKWKKWERNQLPV